MRMSEFNRPENEKGGDILSSLVQKPALPDDFTEEDLAFAAELHELFSPEKENLPPYYIQTLLDVDDHRFEPVVRGFEYKTSARVFRRLKVRRRLFSPQASVLGSLSSSLNDASVRRSALTMIGTFMLIMLLTVAFTGSSFASGVSILLRGTHTSGAYQISKYPAGLVHAPFNPEPSGPSTKQISLLNMQRQVHFPVYWPSYSLPGYTLQHINFYVGLDQQWADGPILEFQYSLLPSFSSKGSGKIWIREFLPRTDVLQLVQEGAASPIDQNAGGALAIYVNGQWIESTSGGSIWQYGSRSELIYQINGVVFWIVGDQQDDVGEKELMRVATGLELLPMKSVIRTPDNPSPITQRKADDIPGPFSTDVIIIFTSDSGDANGPYYIGVTTSQPPKNAH